MTLLCLCLDDYIAIGADEEELGSQIEEDILCVYIHNGVKNSLDFFLPVKKRKSYSTVFVLIVLVGKGKAVCDMLLLFSSYAKVRHVMVIVLLFFCLAN